MNAHVIAAGAIGTLLLGFGANEAPLVPIGEMQPLFNAQFRCSDPIPETKSDGTNIDPALRDFLLTDCVGMKYYSAFVNKDGEREYQLTDATTFDAITKQPGIVHNPTRTQYGTVVELLSAQKADAAVISFDAATKFAGLGPGVTITQAYTTAGTERFLIIDVEVETSRTNTANTYALAAMTALDHVAGGTSYQNDYNWYLINPASGSNNIVVTQDGSDFINLIAASYNGVHQTVAIDVHGTSGPTSAQTSMTLTGNIASNGAWLWGFFRSDSASWSAGAGTTFRTAAEANLVADSNAALPLGNSSLTATVSSSKVWGIYTAIIPATPPASSASGAATPYGSVQWF